jgi:hypothetical protein
VQNFSARSTKKFGVGVHHRRTAVPLKEEGQGELWATFLKPDFWWVLFFICGGVVLFVEHGDTY